MGVSGIIATNSTVDHSGIPSPRRTQGGLSGTPLRGRSGEVLKYIKTKSRLPVISVGGIMNPTDALARLDAGADLIQLYTGFIYRGPGIVRAICRSLLDFLVLEQGCAGPDNSPVPALANCLAHSRRHLRSTCDRIARSIEVEEDDDEDESESCSMANPVPGVDGFRWRAV
jgi:putative redox protein